jgi:hypothetical protein
VKPTEMVCAILGMGLSAAVLLSPAACTINRQTLIADAIKSGADPTAAKCAIESEVGATPQCVAYEAGRARR